MSGPRRWIAAILLTASVLVLGGCNSTDYSPIATMKAMSAWAIPQYPGATLLSWNEVPWTQNFETGTSGAYISHTYGTNATWDAVCAYYDFQIKALGGWTGGPAVWEKDRVYFGILEQDLGAKPEYKAYTLVFDVTMNQDTSATP